MKASPPHVAPITADQLRRIIEGLGDRYRVPSSDALNVLAAVLTGMQSCNDPDDWGRGGEFEVRVEATTKGSPAHIEGIKGSPARLDKRGLLPRLTFDADKRTIGHPRRRRRGLLPDIAAEFRKAMKPTNPNAPLGDRDGPVADFVAAVIPLIFQGHRLSASAAGQRITRARR
jgi:hypothetical protein